MLTRSSRRTRLAIAVTELAIGLPIVLLVAMATMEACTMVRLRQKLKIISYEGARIGVLPDAKITNVTYQCNLLSDDQSLRDVDIKTSPANPKSLDSGDWFEVTATAPFNQNSLTGAWMGSAYTVSESVTIRKP